MAMQSVDALRALIEPGVKAVGLELWDVELQGPARHRTLKVTIDSAEGVNLDDCARVSGQLSAILDVADPLPENYRLEVSSPGLDRVLVRPEHFRRFVGSVVRVRMGGTGKPAGKPERHNFTGRLVDMNDVRLVLETEDGAMELPLESVERARLVPEVSGASPAGKTPRRRGE